MSEDMIADTKTKLDDLEQRIIAAKASVGGLSEDAARAWKEMVEKHSDIRRKLDARDDHPRGVVEGLRYDVDILNRSFEGWVAKVQDKFDR